MSVFPGNPFQSCRIWTSTLLTFFRPVTGSFVGASHVRKRLGHPNQDSALEQHQSVPISKRLHSGRFSPSTSTNVCLRPQATSTARSLPKASTAKGAMTAFLVPKPSWPYRPSPQVSNLPPSGLDGRISDFSFGFPLILITISFGKGRAEYSTKGWSGCGEDLIHVDVVLVAFTSHSLFSHFQSVSPTSSRNSAQPDFPSIGK